MLTYLNPDNLKNIYMYKVNIFKNIKLSIFSTSLNSIKLFCFSMLLIYSKI